MRLRFRFNDQDFTARAGNDAAAGPDDFRFRGNEKIAYLPRKFAHWHGATPNNAMTHIAVQEVKDGMVVEWMEHVDDEQYGA